MTFPSIKELKENPQALLSNDGMGVHTPQEARFPQASLCSVHCSLLHVLFLITMNITNYHACLVRRELDKYIVRNFIQSIDAIESMSCIK